jgi:CdiI immunity protein
MSHYYLREPHPFLRQLLGGWFHQDFDIDGDSLEEILAKCKSVTPEEEVLGVKLDIETLLRNSGDDLDNEFAGHFRSDIDPAGWGMTTREWLLRVHEIL